MVMICGQWVVQLSRSIARENYSLRWKCRLSLSVLAECDRDVPVIVEIGGAALLALSR
jgi:hypothetical protein